MAPWNGGSREWQHGPHKHPLIEIKGLAEPKSKEAARICQEDLNEVIAAFVQDKTAIERGLFDEELIPEELTQVRMGKIIKDKYPELGEEDQEAVQHREDRDIFERLYAVRLDRLRAIEECRSLLAALDHRGLLTGAEIATAEPADPNLLIIQGKAPFHRANEIESVAYPKGICDVGCSRRC